MTTLYNHILTQDTIVVILVVVDFLLAKVRSRDGISEYYQIKEDDAKIIMRTFDNTLNAYWAVENNFSCVSDSTECKSAKLKAF